MTTFEINHLVGYLKNKLPNAKIKVTNKGEEPKMAPVHRYQVDVQELNHSFRFNSGGNLVFGFNETFPIPHFVPHKILKNLPLLGTDHIKKFIDECISELEVYTTKRELPVISIYARKFLGKEKKVEKHPKVIYVYYDNFIVMVTPFIVLMTKKGGRAVFHKEIKNEKDIEDAFKLMKIYAESINEGKL